MDATKQCICVFELYVKKERWALQECREACGGQGLKTDNRVGQLKAEYDVQLTFEGDNNVLMQQVGFISKLYWDAY